MPNTAAVREQRLRKTKAQLIDELESFERCVAASEGRRDGNASGGGKAPSSDDYLANQALLDLARFPSENPNPVLRVTPEGELLYANGAAQAVEGLLTGGKKGQLPSKLAKVATEVSRTGAARESEFQSGDRVFAFSIAPVAGESYINIYGRDISREHAAKRELAEKEAQLRIALDSMPGALGYIDEDLNVVLCNERLSEMYQTPRELLQPGRPYADFLRYLAKRGYYGEGDVEALVAERVDGLRTPSGETFEDLTPDGRVYHIRRQRVAAGGTVTVATDITERKRDEEKLRDQNHVIELLQRIAENANAAASIDEALQICVNEICRDTGWPVGHAYLHRPGDGVDLVPSKVWHLDNAETYESFREVTERRGFARGVGLPGRVLATGEAHWIVDVTRDPNFPRAKEAEDIGVRGGFAFPISAGEEIVGVLEFFAAEAVEPDQGILNIMANVGAQLGGLILRKQSEQQLRDSEERLSAILEASPIGVSIFDGNNIRQYANRRLAEMFGCTQDDMIGQDSTSSFADPAVRDRLLAEYEAAGVVRDFEAEFVRADGSTYWVLVTQLPLGHDGEGSQLVWVYDITERKQAEEGVRQAKEIAQSAYLTLKDTQDSLIQAEKLASLGRLVAGISHEINSPIGVTLTAASHLMEKTAEFSKQVDGDRLSPADLTSFVELSLETSQLMVTNIGRAAELIQSFKQIAVDQTSAERRQFNLNDYIHEILLILRPHLRKTLHQVSVACPENIELKSYPSALSQVLTNFIMNSLVHAYGEGETGQLSIVVREPSADTIELRYADDGKGIPSNLQSKIFDPFFTTSRSSGGSGLGLNIAYNLVIQKLQGKIWVESEAGLGTTFVIRFPKQIQARDNETPWE